MANKTISLTLSEAQVNSLMASFASSGTELNDAQIRTIVNLAVDSWVELFAGRKRYRSLTEQYLDWLGDIYDQVLTAEEPNETRLFSQFGFPYGQAQYFARILRNQRLGTWRKKALERLKQVLSADLKKAQDAVQKKRPKERMEFQMSKASRVELTAILSGLLEANTTGIIPIKSEGTVGDYITVSIAASNVEMVLKEIDKLLQG
jgi:hypothetical protein